MSRVIILEPCHVDVSSADRYGELVTLFPGRRSSPFDTDEYEAEILSGLKSISYDPDEDVICLAGKIVCVSVLCALLAREYGAFGALLFDASGCRYVRRVIGSNNRQETVET